MPSADPPRDDAADPDLDAAILAHDQVRTAYIMRNRAVRRRMAIIAFTVLMGGGVVLITYGLSSDAAARRIAEIANIIVAFMFTIAGYISVYMGVGAFDNRSMMGGGMMGGGMYGGGMMGGGMSGLGGGLGGLAPRLSRTTPIASAAASEPTKAPRGAAE